MIKAQVTKDDIRAKRREADVGRYDQVKAMVMEATGDITVLRTNHGFEVDADLFGDIKRGERLRNKKRERRS